MAIELVQARVKKICDHLEGLAPCGRMDQDDVQTVRDMAQEYAVTLQQYLRPQYRTQQVMTANTESILKMVKAQMRFRGYSFCENTDPMCESTPWTLFIRGHEDLYE